MMNKNYDKYLIMHELLEVHSYDEYQFPIIKKDDFIIGDLEKLKVVNFPNMNYVVDKENTAILMFKFDKVLNRLWNDPYKYLMHFIGFKAICTPDFSVFPGMNLNDVRFNVYRNRWIGAFLQENNIKVIPTIQWCDKNTYDICFSGIEKGGVVFISTLGCIKHPELFLKGFNEMKKRLEPKLILVYGKIIEGMTGKMISFAYEDAFIRKCVKEDDNNGR